MRDQSRRGRAPQSAASSGGTIRTTYRRTLRAALAILATGTGLVAIYSCSLIVDTQSQQCQSDGDCATLFGAGSTCHTATGVCMTTSASSSSSSSSSNSGSGSSSSGSPPTCDVDGGIDGGGCYNSSLTVMCPLDTNAQILNACGGTCTGFDNATRLTHWDGGALPSLPATPPDGGM